MKRFKITIARDLARNEDGSASVEAVMVFPMLVWMALLMFTFFDVFKVQNASYRGNYTISDMLSRQTDPVDQSFLNGLEKVYRFMTYTKPSVNAWLRVSVIKCTQQCNDESQRHLAWVWSHATNGHRQLDNTDLVAYRSKVPLLPLGDQLILVETSRHYKPPFLQGLVPFGERNIDTYVFTRPRFANQLCWVTCAPGSGNGGGGGVIN